MSGASITAGMAGVSAIASILNQASMISDPTTASQYGKMIDVLQTGAKFGGAAAISYANAKQALMSISEKSKKTMMMYKVLVSSGIREAELAHNICKYLESMYAIFTLLVLGYNPMARTNGEIDNIIKGISAESGSALGILDKRNLKKLMDENLSDITDHLDYGNRSPRIGPNARSVESKNPVTINKDIDEDESIDIRKEWSPSTFAESRFMESILKYTKGTYPTVINMKVATGHGGETVSIPIAVKCNIYPIGSEEMRCFMESAISGKQMSFIRSIKMKSGEISWLSWLLGKDIEKRDQKLYARLGRNPWYREFLERKRSARNSFFAKFFTRLGATDPTIDDQMKDIDRGLKVCPPTASLIVSKEDLVAATRLSIDHFQKNEGFVARIIKDCFLLCFGIVDLAEQSVKFFFMGYKDPFIVTFEELKKRSDKDETSLYDAIKELSRKV